MEIYKDLNTKANKDFESLLNSQLSKIKIEEGAQITPCLPDFDTFCAGKF